MIINKFKNHSTYNIIKILSIIGGIVIILFFIMLVDKMNLPPLVIPSIILCTILYFIMPLSVRNLFIKFIDKNISASNLKLIEGEKILFDKLICPVSLNAFGLSFIPQNIIITNFRISMITQTVFTLIDRGKNIPKITSFWNLQKVPPNYDVIFNILMKDIAYGVNNKREFIIVRYDFIYPRYCEIIHPNAHCKYMVIDIELTLNRFGFGKISENKFQFLCFRFSIWKIPNKYSISFEVNWRKKEEHREARPHD
jgi:hypothetical protein